MNAVRNSEELEKHMREDHGRLDSDGRFLPRYVWLPEVHALDHAEKEGIRYPHTHGDNGSVKFAEELFYGEEGDA